MKILALEPYYGGSHRAFIDGWIELSRHEWTLLTLPANKWKWRMRHAAITFAGDAAERVASGEAWDLLFCSDMLNLAEFAGLAPAGVRALPKVAYFHENQVTYPVEHTKEYDYHFAFSNLTTALAAEQAWFNSAFHRDAFLSGLRDFLKRMPDYQPVDVLDEVRRRSVIRPPCVALFTERGPRADGPMRVVWAARWEYDKGPETFFQAMERLAQRNVAFRLSVLGGGTSRQVLPVFEQARQNFAGCIEHWGFEEDRAAYEEILRAADVIVSTAEHEFFGIGIVEGVAAGCYPLVPRRLAYPEVLAEAADGDKDTFFHDGTERDLAERLEVLAGRLARGDLWQGAPRRGIHVVERFGWNRNIPLWDNELEALASS